MGQGARPTLIYNRGHRAFPFEQWVIDLKLFFATLWVLGSDRMSTTRNSVAHIDRGGIAVACFRLGCAMVLARNRKGEISAANKGHS